MQILILILFCLFNNSLLDGQDNNNSFGLNQHTELTNVSNDIFHSNSEQVIVEIPSFAFLGTEYKSSHGGQSKYRIIFSKRLFKCNFLDAYNYCDRESQYSKYSSPHYHQCSFLSLRTLII